MYEIRTARMEERSNGSMDKQLLKEKAKHYLVCYYEPCERREHCLHWLAGPFVPETDRVQTCVNVTNKEVRAGRCPFYKPDVPVQTKRGFTHLYDDMPKRIGTAIRMELDAHYGHTMYYKYRNGELPVTPDMQRHIAEVCRKHGWTAEPVYDKNTEEYDWG